MTELNYQESLEIIENFMEESRIREYCTDICKGECCGECYNSENACHRNEGRRLGCSIFLCNPIKRLLLKRGTRQLYNRTLQKIEEEICGVENMYFNVNTQKMKDNFSINKDYFDYLGLLDIDYIKCLMEYLIKHNVKRYCIDYRDISEIRKKYKSK